MTAKVLRNAAWVYLLSASVYLATLGVDRATTPTPDGHFVHLADSYLHGQLDVVGGRPPTGNDWALYKGRWFVSFPPFPAVLILPAVAIWGTATWDRLFWTLFAGLGPALVYLLLQRLNDLGRASRSHGERLLLTALFAFGTVYYFSAIQGSVWFAAHIVACVLCALYLLCALDARCPLLAGLCLGLSFMTRPTMLLLGGIFVVELALRSHREQQGLAAAKCTQASLRELASSMLRKRVWWGLVCFCLPLVAVCGVAMALNEARFDSPLSFGHEYLQIRWRGRIDRYGLFGYHYLGRNLGIFLASLPWIMDAAPYVRVSRHGLALWVTTPNLLGLLWPKKSNVSLVSMTVFACLVALLDLTYQNSGWVQFGYRFALDYMVVLIAMLAIGGRRFGAGFYAMAVFAVIVNLFGAITFDRMWQFYDRDPTQRVIFQPD